MRLLRGQPAGDADIVGFLVIGDGSRDETVLRSLLEKFDGERAVLMPQDRPALGLEGSLDLAAYLIGRFGKDMLIVIDREHFDGRLFRRLLSERFSEYRMRRRAGGFRHLEVRRGTRSANLYVAIMGREKALEENLAVLIREILGEKVEGTKEAVWGFLEKHKLRVDELIERAGEGRLKTAFPAAFIELLKRWGRGGRRA